MGWQPTDTEEQEPQRLSTREYSRADPGCRWAASLSSWSERRLSSSTARSSVPTPLPLYASTRSHAPCTLRHATPTRERDAVPCPWQAELEAEARRSEAEQHERERIETLRREREENELRLSVCH